MTGVMCGAVTNTPSLAAAQAAIKDMHIVGSDTSIITLAYAVAYPFAVVGIIISLVLLKRILKVDIEKEKELHRKLAFFQSNRPTSIHLQLENKQLYGQPIRKYLKF